MALTVGELVAYMDVDDSKFNKKTDQAGSKWESLSSGLTKGGVAMSAAITAPIALLVKSSIEGVAAIEQGVMKANTVFGGSVSVVEDWAGANASAMGLTAKGALGLAANFGDLLVPMGFTREAAASMSTDVIGLSGALSAWTGGTRSAAEVSDILAKAMLGEREGLKELGISITEAEVDARLLEKGQEGLTGAALAQAKAIATQELIMEKSVDAQKAFGDSTETLSEKQLKSAAGFAQLKETLGESLLPVVSALTGAFTKIMNVFNGLPGPVKTIIFVLAGILAVVGPLLIVIGMMIPALTALAGAFAAGGIAAGIFGAVMAVITSPITLIIVAIVALIAIGYLLIKHWDDVKAGALKVWGWIKDFFVNIGSAVMGVIGDLAGTLYDIGKDLLSGLWDGVKWVWGTILKPFYVDLPLAIVGFIGDVLATLYQKGKDLLQGLWDGIVWIWDTILKPFYVDLPLAVIGFIGDVLQTLYQKGKDLLTGLWNGIKWVWDAVVQFWFKDLPKTVIDTVGDVAKTLYEKGKDLLTGLWDGIKGMWTDKVRPWLLDFPGLITDALKDVAGAIAGPFKDAWDLVLGEDGWLSKLRRGISAFNPFGDVDAGGAPSGQFGDIDGRGVLDKLGISDFLATAYSPAKSKDGMMSTTTGVWNVVDRMFPGAEFMGGKAWRPPGVDSDHPFGGAFDVGGSWGTMQAIADFLAASFGQMPLHYIIFNREINSGGGWRTYHGSNPHTDHVHVSAYARGGPIPGAGPVPIVAHGGEYVLTRGDTGLMQRLIAALSSNGDRELITEMRLMRQEFRRETDRRLQLSRTGALA